MFVTLRTNIIELCSNKNHKPRVVAMLLDARPPPKNWPPSLTSRKKIVRFKKRRLYLPSKKRFVGFFFGRPFAAAARSTLWRRRRPYTNQSAPIRYFRNYQV